MASFPECPNCGGEVTQSFEDYKAAQNARAEGNEDGSVYPEDDPSGDVGVCSNCGMAVAVTGSDADVTSEATPLPTDPSEHADAADAPVHEVETETESSS